MFSRREVVAGAMSASAAATTSGLAATAGSPSLDELLAQPTALDAAISPDGGRVAVLRVDRSQGQRMAFVTLMDSDKLGAPPTQVTIGDCEVERVAWVDDRRLLVWALLDKDAKGRLAGMPWKGDVLVQMTRRVISMDRAGQNLALLFANQTYALNTRRNLGSVIDLKSTEPDCILMQAWNSQHKSQALYRVNVVSGEATLQEMGGFSTDSWLTQDGIPVLRLDSSGSSVSVYGRAPGEKAWKFFRKFRRDEFDKLDGMQFLSVSDKPGVLYAAVAGSEGEDKASVRTFDLRTFETGPAIGARPNFDVTGCVTDRAGLLVATTWIEDRRAYDFVDPELAKHYRGVCSYFANACNVELVDISADRVRFVLRVTGPRHVGSYWLYDRRAARLEPLAIDRPALTQARLARMDILKLRARDGLPLTAYLSSPPGLDSVAAPLVVIPHGGPETRDAYDFDALVQAYCAQGWRVLQVNFRGSAGYGRAFAQAGRLHWGDLMQNDVEDALATAIERTNVEQARIAISGISYGGYAALMGAVKTPERYRAVISIAGDTDLFESLAMVRENDGADSLAYSYWRAQMGDPTTDRARIAAASPALHAGAIRAPVLLQHGAIDGVVGVEQSRRMQRALKAAGREVEYVELPTESHPMWKPANHAQMVTRCVAHIGRAFGQGRA
jgi:dipeptidyl aminopeptidase/acylaminoacyl peptidase